MSLWQIFNDQAFTFGKGMLSHAPYNQGSTQ